MLDFLFCEVFVHWNNTFPEWDSIGKWHPGLEWATPLSYPESSLLDGPTIAHL